MKLNELDRLFLMNYLVGGAVVVSCIFGMFFVLLFKDFSFAVNFNFHKGIGFIQTVITCILFIIMSFAVKFIQMTKKYQDHYGE